MRNERQRHALGWQQTKVDAHIDDRLQSELRHQPGRREQDEVVVLAQRPGQASENDGSEQADQQQTGDEPKLLAGNGKDEVCVGVRQHLLNHAFAWTAAEQPTQAECLKRGVDLVTVAARRIEKVLDAAGRRHRGQRGQPATGAEDQP